MHATPHPAVTPERPLARGENLVRVYVWELPVRIAHWVIVLSIFVLGFTAAVIGGLESPVGAGAGGVILGVVLSYAGGYLGSQVVSIFGLAALVLVLMLRPNGLFSASSIRRV